MIRIVVPGRAAPVSKKFLVHRGKCLKCGAIIEVDNDPHCDNAFRDYPCPTPGCAKSIIVGPVIEVDELSGK